MPNVCTTGVILDLKAKLACQNSLPWFDAPDRYEGFGSYAAGEVQCANFEKTLIHDQVIDRLHVGIRVGVYSAPSQRWESLCKPAVRNVLQLPRFEDFAAMPEYAPDAAVTVQ